MDSIAKQVKNDNVVDSPPYSISYSGHTRRHQHSER